VGDSEFGDSLSDVIEDKYKKYFENSTFKDFEYTKTKENFRDKGEDKMTTEETVKILLKKGIFREVEDLNEEELFRHRRELKELIANIPEDEPGVIANFLEDLEDVEKIIKTTALKNE